MRLERAAQLMKATPAGKLSGIAHEAGFNSLSDFSRTFRQRYGMAPSRWDRRTRLNACAGSSHVAQALPYDLQSMVAADDGPLAEPVLRELPRLAVAYVRISPPFEAGALTRGYQRLREWLSDRGLQEERLVGLSWDDVDVTPIDHIRYDLGCTVPRGTRGGNGVSVMDLPPLLIVAQRATGSMPRVARVWDHLYHAWLPRSRFEPYNLPPLEWYHSWPETLDADDWDLDCCIPLRALREFPQDPSSSGVR